MTTDTWDDFAADWDTESDARYYADRAFDSWQRKVAHLVSNLGDTRVLDFGCGTGLLTEKISPLCREVMAVDTSTEMIKVLKRKVADTKLCNVTPMVSAIDSVSLARNSNVLSKFGLVIASSVCGFLPDFESTLQSIASVILPGGIFVQWDWASEMPPVRIRAAFDNSNLECHSIENEFDMVGSGQKMPVVMAVGRRPG